MKYVIITFLALLFSHAVHAQLQNIDMYGTIQYDDGTLAKNIDISIRNGDIKLAETKTDSLGRYSISHKNYGRIKNIDVLVGTDKWFYKKIEMLSPEMPIEYDIIIGKWMSHDVICRGRFVCSWDKIYSGNFRTIISSSGSCSNASVQDRTFRSPYGTLAYYQPQNLAYYVYHKELSYQFKIVDAQKNPIQHARIEIIVPDDESSWGITDSNGKLTINSLYENGILNGKIIISAKGYQTRKIRFQKIDKNNFGTFTLRTNQH